MAPKECRHVAAALSLSHVRKRLKLGGLHCCTQCDGGSTKPKKKHAKHVKLASSLDDVKRNALCITCGFVGCLAEKHDHCMDHIRDNAKHCCFFRMGTQDVWCTKCDAVVDGVSDKVTTALADVRKSYDELIVAKANRMHLYATVEASTPVPSAAPTLETPPSDDKPKNKSKAKASKKTKTEAVDTPSSSSSASKDPLVVAGLANLGNTCYFNSTIQSLRSIFTSSKLHEDVVAHARSLPKAPVTRAFLDFVDGATVSSKKNTFTPSALLSAVRETSRQFRGRAQQDAYELYLALVWAIDDEFTAPSKTASSSPTESGLQQIFVKTEDAKDGTLSLLAPANATMDEIQALVAKKLKLSSDEVVLAGGRQPEADIDVVGPPSFVRTALLGALVNSVTCHTCQHVSTSYDDAISLSLAIPKPASADDDVTLLDCLSAFTAVNTLVADPATSSGYRCEPCNKATDAASFQDASLQMQLFGLPFVLPLHLKRLGKLRKNSSHVAFETTLDVAPFVLLPAYGPHMKTVYHLQAVIVHMGNRYGGHYVAYVRYPDAWYYTSDSLVQRVSEATVLGAEAYMLFYTRDGELGTAPPPETSRL
ncbi:hypothetical protein SDRG_08240 [Saprolegnia diclina VS20]|uniref:Ubiquitin carboxyl-terminal hydrolase n=1 Tax=Saprolegnia diclina (strain VS20) TaxID=1156394 RepID=T0Q847_SAPDV|nr:hypothetical protein SDRG_08240 [Saprolegnia diclina VS20]EQC34024.1 hypothetical protein SDRG_08240 [Saprolegnia diclina VS20]|eukprot:XP_008612336.1 hypothetical protein SDRG_08240 [Saprolegnia diclina VS20]